NGGAVTSSSTGASSSTGTSSSTVTSSSTGTSSSSSGKPAACAATPPAVVAHGGTLYYVAPGGSDTNSGSSTAPWLTLQHAADTVHAGDSVIVKAGNYQGFQINVSGTAAAPIVFGADPSVVIDKALSLSGNLYGIDSLNQQYITIQGFTVVPPASDPAW